MITKYFVTLATLIITLTITTTTNAALINFEDIAVAPGVNNIAGDRQSNNFLFDAGRDHSHLINARLGADNGSTYLALDDHYGQSILTITNLDNDPFSLTSIDIGEWSARTQDNATSVRVSAHTNNNEYYTTILELDGIFDGTGPQDDFQTFTFDNWNNLHKIEIAGHGGFRGGAYAIDNLVMPEPNTLALITLFASTILARRRN